MADVLEAGLLKREGWKIEVEERKAPIVA